MVELLQLGICFCHIFVRIFLSKGLLINTPDPGKRGTRAEGAHHINGSLPFIQMVSIYFVRL